MSDHAKDPDERLPELADIEVPAPEGFAKAVVRRIEAQSQATIVVEFLVVGLFLALAGMFGLGWDGPATSRKSRRVRK